MAVSDMTAERWEQTFCASGHSPESAALLRQTIAIEAGLVLDEAVTVEEAERRLVQLDQTCRELDLSRFGIEQPDAVRLQLILALWLEYAEEQLGVNLGDDDHDPVPFGGTLVTTEHGVTEKSNEERWSAS